MLTIMLACYGSMALMGLILLGVAAYYTSEFSGTGSNVPTVLAAVGGFLFVIGGGGAFAAWKRILIIQFVLMLVECVLFVVVFTSCLIALMLGTGEKSPVSRAVSEAWTQRCSIAAGGGAPPCFVENATNAAAPDVAEDPVFYGMRKDLEGNSGAIKLDGKTVSCKTIAKMSDVEPEVSAGGKSRKLKGKCKTFYGNIASLVKGGGCKDSAGVAATEASLASDVAQCMACAESVAVATALGKVACAVPSSAACTKLKTDTKAVARQQWQDCDDECRLTIKGELEGNMETVSIVVFVICAVLVQASLLNNALTAKEEIEGTMQQKVGFFLNGLVALSGFILAIMSGSAIGYANSECPEGKSCDSMALYVLLILGVALLFCGGALVFAIKKHINIVTKFCTIFYVATGFLLSLLGIILFIASGYIEDINTFYDDNWAELQNNLQMTLQTQAYCGCSPCKELGEGKTAATKAAFAAKHKFAAKKCPDGVIPAGITTAQCGTAVPYMGEVACKAKVKADIEGNMTAVGTAGLFACVFVLVTIVVTKRALTEAGFHFHPTSSDE